MMEKYVLLVRLGYHVSIQARMDRQSHMDKNGSFPLTLKARYLAIAIFWRFCAFHFFMAIARPRHSIGQKARSKS